MKGFAQLLVVTLISLFARDSYAQLLIHPQIGGNYDYFNENLEGFEGEGSRLGIVAGCALRMPDRRVQVIPGLFYSDVQANLRQADGDLEELTINRLRLPLSLGLYLNDPDDLIRYRLNAGVQGSWLIAVSSSEQTYSKDDFNDALLDATAGIGIDLAFLTFDLSYNHGLSSFGKFSDNRSNVLNATVGLALNLRKTGSN